MKILTIICSNGLGHFKRCLGLLNVLRQKRPYIQLDIACTKEQITKIGGWNQAAILHQKNCQLHTHITCPGVHWSNNELIYQDDRLVEWEQNLSNFSPLHDADIVLSDNLSAPLKYRPDTVLMGSFLWFDIFENSPYQSKAVKLFIEQEKERLTQYRPPMICVEGIAMPSLLTYVRPIPCPWFAYNSPKKRVISLDSTKRIAILGGATPAVNELYEKLIESILTHTHHELALPNRVIRAFSNLIKSHSTRIHSFEFEQKDYQNADIVICRPGIGTITDCITTQTPMLLFYEPNNLEMCHNATFLSQKGYGINLGTPKQSSEIISSINGIIRNYNTILQQLSKVSTNGFEVASKWILENYNQY